MGIKYCPYNGQNDLVESVGADKIFKEKEVLTCWERSEKTDGEE